MNNFEESSLYNAQILTISIIHPQYHLSIRFFSDVLYSCSENIRDRDRYKLTEYDNRCLVSLWCYEHVFAQSICETEQSSLFLPEGTRQSLQSGFYPVSLKSQPHFFIYSLTANIHNLFPNMINRQNKYKKSSLPLEFYFWNFIHSLTADIYNPFSYIINRQNKYKKIFT